MTKIIQLAALCVLAASVANAQVIGDEVTVGKPIAVPAQQEPPANPGRPAPVPTPAAPAPGPARPAAPAPAPAAPAPVVPAPVASPAVPAGPVIPLAPIPQTTSPEPVFPVAAGAAGYANMPTTWPDANQAHGPINVPALLTSPLVAAGMAKVNAAVPPNLLAVPKSAQLRLGAGDVNYPAGNEVTYCYAQKNCFRDQAGPGYQADIRACPAANAWGLTFDDGPTNPIDGAPATPELMAQLAAMGNTKSTFFVTGSQCYYHPQILKAVHDAGHEIAIHTWNHAALTSMDTNQIVAEILYTEAIIVRTLGVRPVLFRPPFGDVDDRVRAIVTALGLKTVLWSKNSHDSEAGANVASILAETATWTAPGPGFISLQHNSQSITTGWSIDSLKQIQAQMALPTFQRKIQPVAQCLGLSPYIAVAGGAPISAPPAGATATPTRKPTTVYATKTPVPSPAASETPSSASMVAPASFAATVFAAVAGLFAM
ncbi:hypothetical protein PhCBS80983_g05447 [Powellomyces hirtus]|uniref:NodB homology domain-containing protein n=1 Tax=Powellomyces hirtus TaxID=109895 RepID=A0A507DWN1_9FUNG|nr:hypothetical protein PhCBS80983_g05447 [Powellomyces hirtus]